MATKEQMRQEAQDEKDRIKAGKAYDKEMPEPDTTFGRLSKKVGQMRAPTANESSAINLSRSQNRLAKEYEDMDKPKNLVEAARKNVMPSKLRKEADNTFKNLPEEVKEYEAYKDAGYKKGGSVSSASKRADGCAVKGKTKGRFV